MKRQDGRGDIGCPVEEVDTPSLLLDAAVLEANIATLARMCAGKAQRVRPHAKSHKSPIIARMQRDAGAVGLCCAKLAEAEVLGASGVQDILITTPIVGRRKLARLAALLPTLKLTVVADNALAVVGLAEAAAAADRVLDVVIEADVGQGRCGVAPGPPAASLADEIGRHKQLRLMGLQGYQGKLQGIVEFAERRTAVQRALNLLQESADVLQRAGHQVAIMTGGGSGSLPIDLDLGGLNELQPGSYAVMDATYAGIEWDEAGRAIPFRPAISILASVVSRPAPDRAVIDVGWKSASCDAGPPVPLEPDLVFEFAGDEHGIIRHRSGRALNLAVAQNVVLLPSHCDTTINLFTNYTVVRDGCLEAIWPIAARGCCS